VCDFVLLASRVCGGKRGELFPHGAAEDVVGGGGAISNGWVGNIVLRI
jgi:uncharacterized protein YcfJ